MTDDIVALLRELARMWNVNHAPNYYDEAADEIERLRAEVKRRDELIRGFVEAWDWWQVDTYDRCESVPADAVREARAALAGEKAND